MATMMCLALLATAGCKTGSKQTSTTIPSQAENLQGPLDRNMENCPSFVPGAQTTVQNIERGVILTIVGNTEEAAADIRVRARHQATVEPMGDQPVQHSGQGTGGGAMGYCPVVHAGTTVTVTDINAGSQITIMAEEQSQVEQLREVVARRVAAVQQRARSRAGRTVPR